MASSLGAWRVCPPRAACFRSHHRERAAAACAEAGGGGDLHGLGLSGKQQQLSWMAAMQLLHAHSSISLGLSF